MDGVGSVNEYMSNLFGCECGAFCEEEGSDTCNVRGCHRGASEEPVPVINLCAKDHVAGGTDIYGGTEIGLIEPLLILLGRCHSDDFPVGGGKDSRGFLRVAGSGD